VLTLKEQLIQQSKEIQSLGIDISYRPGTLGSRSNGIAYYGTGKKNVALELVDIRNQVVIGIKLTGDSRGEPKRLILRELAKIGIAVDNPTQTNLRISCPNTELTKKFVSILETINSIDEIEDSDERSWKKTAKLDTPLTNIVKIIRIAVESNDTSLLKRSFVDDVTPYVAVNIKTDTLNYGEHVVPIDYLFKYSVKMVQDGVDDESIKDFWQRNLKVVYITSSEARYIDVDLGLQTVMPEGWQDGDDPLARLNEAKVNVIS